VAGLGPRRPAPAFANVARVPQKGGMAMKLGRWFVAWVALLIVVACAPALWAQQQPAAKSAAAAAKVDLNSATQAELEKLPGVGEATAKKTIDGGPSQTVPDREKAGPNKATIEKCTPLLTVGPATAHKGAPKAPEAPKTTDTAKVDLNTASQAELEKLPGVGPATAKKII